MKVQELEFDNLVQELKASNNYAWVDKVAEEIKERYADEKKHRIFLERKIKELEKKNYG